MRGRKGPEPPEQLPENIWRMGVGIGDCADQSAFKSDQDGSEEEVGENRNTGRENEELRQ